MNRNNELRDMFIISSLLVAGLISTASRGNADQIYLCDGGRNIILETSSVGAEKAGDPCITDWFARRAETKQTSSKDEEQTAGDRADASRAAPVQVAAAAEPVVVPQPLLMLVNAEVVSVAPKAAAPASLAVKRVKASSEVKQSTRRKTKVARVAQNDKAYRGLKNMGDGIFAQ